ncbi:MAG: hypothetical protein FWC22_04215 [Treponema sp.]|nr:hypothetical protein [Treponema sp.]
MGDIMKRSEIPSASSLAKCGVAAVGYTAAGIFISILNAISGAGFSLIGIVAGGIVFLIGLGSFFSKDPADKKAGFIITAAGILTVISKTGIPLLAGASRTLLVVSAVGLLALGVWNAIKFFRGLKKRS